MSKIRNTGISSRVTGECAAQKIKKLLQFLSMDMFTSYGYIKKPKEKYRFVDDFSLIVSP